MKGSFAFFCLRECVCDFAHLGVHARADDNRFASAVNYGAAHKRHVFSVAQRHFAARSVDDVAGFQHGYGFARERGFFDFHACAFYNPCIRRHGVARFEHDYVAHNQVLALYDHDFAVANDFRRGGGNFLQCVDCFFGLTLLCHSENCVDNDDRHDYDDVGREFFDGTRCIVDRRQYTGYNRRNYENERHRLDKLLQKSQNNRLFFAFRKFVFAVLFKPLLRLLRRQTVHARLSVGAYVVDRLQIVFHKLSFIDIIRA